MEKDNKDDHQVHVPSAWMGNIILVIVVVIILAAGLAYKEFVV